jgi:hypothetical protein
MQVTKPCNNNLQRMEAMKPCDADLQDISYVVVKNDLTQFDPHEEELQVYHENPNKIGGMKVIPYRLGHKDAFIQVQEHSHAMVWGPGDHVFDGATPTVGCRFSIPYMRIEQQLSLIMNKHEVCGDLYHGTNMLTHPLVEISQVYRTLDDDLQHDRELLKMGHATFSPFAFSAIVDVREGNCKSIHIDYIECSHAYSYRAAKEDLSS